MRYLPSFHQSELTLCRFAIKVSESASSSRGPSPSLSTVINAIWSKHSQSLTQPPVAAVSKAHRQTGEVHLPNAKSCAHDNEPQQDSGLQLVCSQLFARNHSPPSFRHYRHAKTLVYQRWRRIVTTNHIKKQYLAPSKTRIDTTLTVLDDRRRN